MRSPPVSRVLVMLERVFCGVEGSCARVVTSWVLAGGVVGGGILIGVLALAGYGSVGLHLLLAPLLFIAGTFLGFAHGITLAVVGRPARCSRGRAIRVGLTGCLVALPLVGVAWLVSSGITLTTVLLTEWRLSWMTVAGMGWILGSALCVWAAIEGVQAVRYAYQRCPQHRIGVGVVVSLFLLSIVLLELLLLGREGMSTQGSRFGGVGLAALGTLWVWVPSVYLSLHCICGESGRPDRWGRVGVEVRSPSPNPEGVDLGARSNTFLGSSSDDG